MKRLYSLLSLLMLAAGTIWGQTVVSMSVEQNPVFGVSTNKVTAAISGSALQLGADVVVTGGSGTYTYRWYNSDGELGQNSTLWVQTAGEYKLDITDTCDCLQTVTFTVTGTAGVDNITAAVLRVAPNPTEGPLHITAPMAVSQVVVFSAQGAMQRVFNGNNVTDIDLSQLAAGQYVLNIVTADGTVSTAKVIKK